MANVGRVYKRLFERDFGYRPLATFSYLPARYKFNGFAGLPSNCIRYQTGFFASTEGVADYDGGKVTWEITSPSFITAGAFIRIEWILTNDPDFGRFRTTYGIGSTDWYQNLGNKPETIFPTVSIGPTTTWIISPTPTCQRGLSTFSVWRWQDGPP